MSINNNLKIAVQAAIYAGKQIMEVYNQPFGVEMKIDNSPLTIADKRANEVINQYLEPTHNPIISEENKQISYQVRRHWQTCWMIDPLDGTKEFIKKNGEFTVNIALIEQGQPTLGVIYVPASKTLYFADVNSMKAYKYIVDLQEHSFEEVFTKAKQITVKKVNHDIIRVVGSRSHMNKDTLSFIKSLKDKGHQIDIVSKGSSLKFCLIAEGQADIYPRFAPTMEWDTAAGQAICNAIGIEVIDQSTGKSLKYNKENLLNNHFVVSI